MQSLNMKRLKSCVCLFLSTLRTADTAHGSCAVAIDPSDCHGNISLSNGFAGQMAVAKVGGAAAADQRACMGVHTTERDSIISKQILTQGHYGHSSLFASVFEAQKNTPHAVFLDVGANVGLHTVQALSFGLLAVSFEPNPITAALLKWTTNVNCWHKRIHFVPAAVGNEEQRGSRMSLVVHTASPGMSTLADPQLTRNIEFSGGKFTVNVTTVDHALQMACKRHGSTNPIKKIVLMKVDVEGFEVNALKGAISVLKGRLSDCVSQPELIHVEVFPELLIAAKTNPTDILDILESSGYILVVGLGGGHNDGSKLSETEVNDAGFETFDSYVGKGSVYRVRRTAFEGFLKLARQKRHLDVLAVHPKVSPEAQKALSISL